MSSNIYSYALHISHPSRHRQECEHHYYFVPLFVLIRSTEGVRFPNLSWWIRSIVVTCRFICLVVCLFLFLVFILFVCVELILSTPNEGVFSSFTWLSMFTPCLLNTVHSYSIWAEMTKNRREQKARIIQPVRYQRIVIASKEIDRLLAFQSRSVIKRNREV